MKQNTALTEQELGEKVFAVLREYKLNNMQFDDGSDFYPLVDLMTRDGHAITDGEEEMRRLAGEVSSELIAHIRTLTQSQEARDLALITFVDETDSTRHPYKDKLLAAFNAQYAPIVPPGNTEEK